MSKPSLALTNAYAYYSLLKKYSSLSYAEKNMALKIIEDEKEHSYNLGYEQAIKDQRRKAKKKYSDDDDSEDDDSEDDY